MLEADGSGFFQGRKKLLLGSCQTGWNGSDIGRSQLGISELLLSSLVFLSCFVYFSCLFLSSVTYSGVGERTEEYLISSMVKINLILATILFFLQLCFFSSGLPLERYELTTTAGTNYLNVNGNSVI